jgi:frataxin-like iron-binding protein CyaY
VTDKLTVQLDQSSKQLGGLLDTTAERLGSQLDHASSGLSAIFNTNTEFLTTQLDKTSSGLTNLFNAKTKGLTDQLDQTSTELSALFTANTKMMTEQLDATASDVTNVFADTAVRVTRQVSEANALMAQRLEQTSAEVTDQLDTAGNSLFARIDQTARDLGQRLERTSTTVTAQLDTAGGNMFAKIDQTARDLGQRFDVATGLLERVTGDISGKLAGTGAKFAEIIDTASTQIITDLGKASEALSSGLGQTTLQITGRLEQDTGLLVGRIDRAARELDSASSTTAGRLDEAHRKFSKHVETANTYLADQLSSAASAIDERLEGISMHLTGKLEMTGTRVSERLDDVTSLVERSIDKFNAEMERVLVNRKDALDHLIGDAGRRATEIDAVMTSYMNLIEDSLAASETRAKDLSRIIAEQTTAATANLDQEIRKLETSSGGQITQASRILRDQHERAMASMNEMLSATASDFQQTAQDMRITAQQVVKDIDTARAELKRAIIDLPEETRSNADAMRRVVSDQISALNALAEVVKRQTGTLDLSGPGISMPRSYRDPSPGKSEGATVQAPQPGPLGAPAKMTERSENSRSKDASDPQTPRDKILADLASSTAKIDKDAKVTAAMALPREMEGLVEKLNAAARDLVEAIDGSLPRDLEKLFAGGDRGVYTHRLYEGRGKRLQRLIVERYGSDRLVRGRVDSYVRLFERLLDMMSAAPQGEAMVEACLASESGRIYVMLAEAAGRIPPP